MRYIMDTLDEYANNRNDDGRIYVALSPRGIKVGHTQSVTSRQSQYDSEQPGTYIVCHMLGSLDEEQGFHDRLYSESSGRNRSARLGASKDRGDLQWGREWWRPTPRVIGAVMHLLNVGSWNGTLTWVGHWNTSRLVAEMHKRHLGAVAAIHRKQRAA